MASDFPALERLPPGDTLMATLGMEIVEARPERVVVTMPVTPRVSQGLGYLHGGASVALAETAASLGGGLNRPPGTITFGQEINANHVRPMREGLLTATATPLHVGRSSQVWQVEIRDEQGRLVCVSRCTIAAVPVGGSDVGGGAVGADR